VSGVQRVAVAVRSCSALWCPLAAAVALALATLTWAVLFAAACCTGAAFAAGAGADECGRSHDA